MGNKDVQDYLEKGMYGSPQLKPEEKKKYLGCYRERLFLTMTIKEMENPRHIKNIQTEVQKHPDQQVFINAATDFRIQSKYMAVVQSLPCSFTIVDTENQANPEAIGLVYASDEAVNFDTVAVSEKYPLDNNTARASLPKHKKSDEEEKKKSHFLTKLFK